MRLKFFGISLTLLMILCFTAPGCASNNTTTIKIGCVYPFSGAQAASGQDIRHGLLLAADIINNQYDLDLPLARTAGIASLNRAKIELIFADSQGSESVARSETQRLIQQEKVAALIGCYQSVVTAAASQVAEEHAIPFIADTSTAPSLTQRGYQWFFRTTPDDLAFIENFFRFLKDMQQKTGTKISKIGLVYENSIFGTEFAGNARQYAVKEGYRIVEDISYPANTANVIEEVNRLKSAAPEVVMQASYAQDAVLFMRTYKQLGFSPAAILANDAGFNSPEFVKSLGQDSQYIFTRDLWSMDWAENSPAAKKVNETFKERYQADMTGASARAFTGLMVLAEAIQRAGSTSQEDIRRALLSTDLSADSLIMPWEGVKFDPQTHQNLLAGGLISQIIDQEYRTVWPGKLAAREPVWPAPGWLDQR
jgi:branched-chain amino acid transport system substrate-binding protein